MAESTKNLLKKSLFNPLVIVSTVTAALYVGGYYHQKGFKQSFQTYDNEISISFYEALVKGLEAWYQPLLRIFITFYLLYLFFAIINLIMAKSSYVQEKIIYPLQRNLNKKKKSETFYTYWKVNPYNQGKENELTDPFYFWFLVFCIVCMIFLSGFSNHAMSLGEEEASNIKWKYQMAIKTQVNCQEMRYPSGTSKIFFKDSEKKLVGVVIDRSENYTMVYDTSGTYLLNNSAIEKKEVLIKGSFINWK